MSDIPRLNSIIAALEKGGPAFASFASIDIQTAISMAATNYDGIVFEGEHSGWDDASEC